MGLRTMPLPTETQRKIETALQDCLVALVESGQDVVLDFSFWSLRVREEYRRLLRPLGVEPETIYLATPREVALARPRDRATRHPNDFFWARKWLLSILTISRYRRKKKDAMGGASRRALNPRRCGAHFRTSGVLSSELPGSAGPPLASHRSDSIWAAPPTGRRSRLPA
jgi:hypothetical protein